MFFLRLIKGIFNVIKHNKRGLEVVLIDKHILFDMIHDLCRQCVWPWSYCTQVVDSWEITVNVSLFITLAILSTCWNYVMLYNNKAWGNSSDLKKCPEYFHCAWIIKSACTIKFPAGSFSWPPAMFIFVSYTNKMFSQIVLLSR